MFDNFYRKQIETLFEAASIRIEGGNPWDIHVHEPLFFKKVLSEGNLGLGEAYMDGWWDCSALDEFFYRLLCSKTEEKVFIPSMYIGALAGKVCNFQKPSRAFTVGEKHYDIGNDLFMAMLDRLMVYSCAYWENADDLDSAQENKLRLTFNKLMLEPGMSILDIGCGWGGAAKFAAEHYGVKVTGITVSCEQVDFALKLCAGLPVDIRFMDYRDLSGSFDRIYSIGMLEHVGYKNYRRFIDTVTRCLKPDGLFLLHSIGGNVPVASTDPWISKYIFPNSMIPSASQIAASCEGRLILEDWHTFTYDYYLTLKAWNRNFEKNWPELQGSYSERFHRMWRYYLLSCAGAFKARLIQLWQILLSRNGIKGECRIIREVREQAVRDKESGEDSAARTHAPDYV
jgi:cyclopropane-fatty-acyl-phospholipid synthase